MNLKKLSNGIKFTITILIVLTSLAFASIKLMNIQIVDSETYVNTVENYQTVEQPIPSFRGEIVDAKGKNIVSNKLGFDVVVDKSEFTNDLSTGNDILIQTVRALKDYDYKWTDKLPITMTEPYTYIDDSDYTPESLRNNIGVNVYASAEDCMYKLIKDYQISDQYTPQEQRIIAGIRYQMDRSGFSIKNRYTLCEDVPREAITYIEELSLQLKGVDVTEEAIREYSQVDVIPHEIGFVGPIFAEESEKYTELGYDLDDTVGKTGIELGMEDVLKGTDGVKEITLIDGVVASTEVTKEAVSGHTVKLTIDSEFQKEIQDVLEDFIGYLNYDRNIKCHAGALAVLDAKTGAVLALATAPTYTLDEYEDDYQSLAEDTSLPLLDRATDGLYRPGSCFKTITATAGLNEGLVSGYSTFYCGHDYHYRGLTVHCTGTHHNIAVTRAIQVSCNIYFYNLAQLVGVDTLSEYAHHYGLGTTLGLESGDTQGYLANPDTFENLGMLWTSGQLLQAGIGQSEIAVTPLQMSVAAMTIANKGVRYKPYLVDSVWDYSMSECVSKTKPTVVDRIDVQNSDMYNFIENGMILASQNTPNGEYSLNGLGYDVAIKTGTPQSARGTDSTFIGYAPADNPQIAFAGIVEGGEYSKYMVRKILDVYEKYYGID